MRRTTLNDIARKAAISVSTVSRVLNKNTTRYRISKNTEKLVIKTAKELNYRPNQLARGLRLRKTHSLGLVVPDISNPFFAYVTRSIQNVAHSLGYSLMVCDTDENLALEVEHIDLLCGKGVDGLIVMPVGQKYHHLERLVNEGIPLVLVDRCFDRLSTNSVIVDNYAGAFDAVEHLINHGHARIAIIQGLPNTYTNNSRFQGYKDALSKHGIPVDDLLVVGKDFRKENGYVETKLLLGMEKPPTAIFSTSDLITLGVLQAVFEEGLNIPDDISIVAFDDIDFGPFLMCPLTTVAQPRESMGEIAVKLLVEQMKNGVKKETRRIVLKPKLVVRDSVRQIAKIENAEVVPS